MIDPSIPEPKANSEIWQRFGFFMWDFLLWKVDDLNVKMHAQSFKFLFYFCVNFSISIASYRCILDLVDLKYKMQISKSCNKFMYVGGGSGGNGGGWWRLASVTARIWYGVSKKVCRDVLFEFHLKFWNIASVGIPAIRLLTSLTAQQKGTTARWYSYVFIKSIQSIILTCHIVT